VLKDLRSGAARPFFDLLLKSALFYAFLPTWKDRLGKSGEERLLEMAGRLDAVCQPEVPVSENILWAMVLTPYVERGNLPEEMKQLRVVIHEQIQAALAGLEFPRQRQEEVTQIMALNRLLTPLLQEDRHIPVRLSRLTTFPEAMLLYQLQHKPVELLAGLSLELPAPAVSPAPRRQGRPRRRPRRNRRRRPDRSVISDQ
jgi:hypothetical protein